jgi:hypothetical protein
MPPRTAQLSQDADKTTVVAVPWEMFRRWFREEWQPGQHVACIGPTGEGKTTFVSQILADRKWVLALDPKGGDRTLSESGFKAIYDWPLDSQLRDDIAEGKPARLIVSGSIRTDRDMAKLVELMKRTVAGVRAEGGWTLYADEFQLLADRRMYGLDKQIEALLIAARSRGTSVVTSFQAPAWVPKAATRQATFCCIWPTRDVNMIKSVAESMGRTWQEVQAAVHELPSYHCLVIPKKVHAPMVVTHAPKL